MTLFPVEKGAGGGESQEDTPGGESQQGRAEGLENPAEAGNQSGGPWEKNTPTPTPRTQSCEGGRWDNMERASSEPSGYQRKRRVCRLPGSGARLQPTQGSLAIIPSHPPNWAMVVPFLL